MIPILYDEQEMNFSSNGLGRLSDSITCYVTEQRNGIFELEMTYPVSGLHYDDIKNGRVIMAAHQDGPDLQPFDIYRVSKPLNGIITVNARHISYRLAKSTVLPFTAGSISQTMARLPEHILPDTPFTFWTDKTVVRDFIVDVPVSARAILGGTSGSILSVYGKGEYVFDRFEVKLYTNRGEKTDVVIRYGKNLSELNDLIDDGDIYSGVVPFWKSEETGGFVMLPEKVVYRSGVDTSSALLSIGGLFLKADHDFLSIEENRYKKIIPLDLSDRFEGAPSIEDLRQAAENFLTNNTPWEPSRTIKINFVQLWQTEEYKNLAPLQRLKLCDRLSVQVPHMGVTVGNIQIVKVKYDCLLERYAAMELGTPTTTLGSVVQAGTSAEILKSVPTKAALRDAVDSATDKITGGLGGHVVIGLDGEGLPNEILIMDTDSKETAVNVVRINMSGIGFSHNGYNGPFETAWTLDGHFVADYIDTGILQANIIKTGILSSYDSNSFWNFDTGELYIEASSVGMADGATLEDELTSNFEEINRYIRFNNGTIELGQIDNPLTLTLQNDQIAFYNGLYKAAYLSDNEMYIKNIRVTESAIITGLVITEDDDSILIDLEA